MPLFIYRARNDENVLQGGYVEAPDANTAAETLMDRGYVVVSLKEYNLPFWQKTIRIWQHVGTRELVVFFRQLSVLISASVPIVQSLRILTNQISNTVLKKAVGELADEVDGGAKLSSAMARYPYIFSSLEYSLIQTGETSGKLDEVMEYLATQEERNYDLISRIRGAMAYPVVVLSLLLLVGVFVMIFIIPQLTSLLTDSGVPLPLATQLLIDLSDLLRVWWWAVLLVLGSLVAGAVAFYQTPYGRWQFNAITLKIPVFGKLLQRIYLVRICRALQTLIIGGVHVTRALTIVSGVVSNVIYKQVIDATVKEVEDGNSITTVMIKSPFVPPMVPQMLAIGEQTGKLDEVLGKVGDFYSREIDNLINGLVSLIEPLIIVAIALGVGFIMVAVMMPLYSLTEAA